MTQKQIDKRRYDEAQRKVAELTRKLRTEGLTEKEQLKLQQAKNTMAQIEAK